MKQKIFYLIFAFFSGLLFSQAGSVGINTLTPDNSSILHIQNFTGTEAVATATVSGGIVTGVNLISGGNGYKTVPTISFYGGGAVLSGGVKASATATMVGGVVTAITLNNGGFGYTSPPTVSLSGGDKGLLIPRINIANVSDIVTPVTAPKDGLLAYNSGINSNKKSFYFFNTTTGRWQANIDAEDTPKIAFAEFTGTHSGLNNAVAGESFQLLVNRPFISPFSNISGFKMVNNSEGGYSLVLPQGNYLIEVKLNLNSPQENPAGVNGTTPLGSGFYLMGYFMDFYPDTYNDTTFVTTPGPRNRKEIPIVSKVNTNHYASWSYLYTIPANVNPNIKGALRLQLGRMQGSTFYDLVNVMPSGSFVRISKL